MHLPGSITSGYRCCGKTGKTSKMQKQALQGGAWACRPESCLWCGSMTAASRLKTATNTGTEGKVQTLWLPICCG